MLLLAFTAAHWGWMVPIENAYENVPWLGSLLVQFEHIEWQGITFWDMIQPSFMFMVGVSMAYSYASRQRQGHSYACMLCHACYRAIVLVLLGVLLRSLGSESTYWTLEDVVSQIGLGYVGLFLLWNKPWKIQLLAALGLLFAYWALFAFWPLPESDYDYAIVDGKVYYEGFFAHWNKNAHPGHYFDQWLLNLFPREADFVANDGGYNTLNFIPSLSTMIFGLMAGELLRHRNDMKTNLYILITAGLLSIAIGWVLQAVGLCPIVKRIWTPSFGLLSTGLCLLCLGFLYALIDLLKWQRWAWPAIIVGRNSIAMYCMIYMVAGWILSTLHTHFGTAIFEVCGDAFTPLLENFSVGLCLWMICWWMHSRKIFLRI
ncbi:hypothetical protein HG15A2_18870 [Adhaeretor mobilis]|uniref:DUF5009 domain-containing protein n=2 Tax=Adhaeretor mobilis TaxID=1930276 RepID=A0A517MUQ5_9BACT|nr:hypothetical protein HG15A2_18870 [Adhaeretor mobilis]